MRTPPQLRFSREYNPKQIIREIESKLNPFLRELGAGIHRIDQGFQTNQSGLPLGEGGSGRYWLLAGRPEDQVAYGSTRSGGFAKIRSTSHGTKGFIYLGSLDASAYDDTNDRLGIGTATPAGTLHVYPTQLGGTLTSVAPSSTVAAGNFLTNLGGTDLHTALNETGIDDTTYIAPSILSPTSCTVGLAALTDPGVDTGFSMIVRGRDTGGNVNMTVTLLEGAVTRATRTLLYTSVYQTFQITFTAGEIAPITNFAALRVGIGSASSIGSTNRTTAVRLYSAVGTPIPATIIVDSKAGQVSDHTQWRDSSQNIQSVMDVNGRLALGILAPTARLHVVSSESPGTLITGTGNPITKIANQGAVGSNILDVVGATGQTGHFVRAIDPSGNNLIALGVGGSGLTAQGGLVMYFSGTEVWRMSCTNAATNRDLIVQRSADNKTMFRFDEIVLWNDSKATQLFQMGPDLAAGPKYYSMLTAINSGFDRFGIRVNDAGGVVIGSRAILKPPLAMLHLMNMDAVTNPLFILEPVAGQTADQMRWYNGGGAAIIGGITAGGNVFIGPTAGLSTTPLLVVSRATTDVVQITRAAASQTGDLQQWQSSAPTVLAGITAGGNLYVGATAGLTTTSGLFVGRATTDKVVIVRGVASQSGSLQEWQNSSSVAKITAIVTDTEVGFTFVPPTTSGFTRLFFTPAGTQQAFITWGILGDVGPALISSDANKPCPGTRLSFYHDSANPQFDRSYGQDGAEGWILLSSGDDYALYTGDTTSVSRRRAKWAPNGDLINSGEIFINKFTVGTTGLSATTPRLRIAGNTSGVLTIQPAAATTTHTLTFPAAQGAAGSVLANNGSGTLSWDATYARDPGSVSLTGQTTALTGQNIIASAGAGIYLITFYIVCTTGTGVADQIDVTLNWNDGTAAHTIGVITGHSQTTAGNFKQVTYVILSAASQAITFDTVLTDVAPVGVGTYAIYARATLLP